MNPTLTTDDILAENLLRRGVAYLSGSAPDAPALDDVTLAVGLASSANARVRHALVAWMLSQPDAHPVVLAASGLLEAPALEHLHLLYSAAVRLQRVFAVELKPLCSVWVPLPDHFRAALLPEASDSDAANALAGLARQHAVTFGALINWEGTYRHIAQVVIRRLTKERSWAIR